MQILPEIKPYYVPLRARDFRSYGPTQFDRNFANAIEAISTSAITSLDKNLKPNGMLSDPINSGCNLMVAKLVELLNR